MPTTSLAADPVPAPAPAAQRDLVLDLVRAGALGVVVLWHWVFTTVAFNDGPSVGNPVGVTPGLWLLTWVLQPMPLFFAVGGCLHARTMGNDTLAFWKRRVHRLLVPALPLLLPAVALIFVANMTGHAAIVRTIVLLISPLWFLGVYLVLVLLAPAAVRAHRRAPVLTFTALVGAAIAVDVARFHLGWTGPAMVLASFVMMWALVHQFGFVLDDLRQATMTTRIAVAMAGLGGLIVLVSVGPYPAAMVGVPGERVSNMGPPTLAPVLLGLFQIGVLATVSDPLARFAARHRRGLDAVNEWTMPVYVWHLIGWALFYAIVRVARVDVPSDPSGAWWLQRPAWLLGPLVVTAPLCWLVRSGPKVRARRHAWTSTSTV